MSTSSGVATRECDSACVTIMEERRSPYTGGSRSHFGEHHYKHSCCSAADSLHARLHVEIAVRNERSVAQRVGTDRSARIVPHLKRAPATTATTLRGALYFYDFINCVFRTFTPPRTKFASPTCALWKRDPPKLFTCAINCRRPKYAHHCRSAHVRATCAIGPPIRVCQVPPPPQRRNNHC